MRIRSFYPAVAALCLLLAGCQEATAPKTWLLVNFEENVPVTYRFTSSRTTQIDLAGGDSAKKSRPQTMSESLTMVITFTPTEVDPYGLTTVEAVCRSVKVDRSSMSGRRASPDAMETMAGETFTFQLSPTGEFAEYTDLVRLIRQVGEHAFDRSSTQRIKNPDMISDFVAMQWYLWDSVATIEAPLEGMEPGDTWQAKQLIPWPAPMPNPPARLTTYQLDSFTADNGGDRKAVIESRYDLSETTVKGYPVPYDGRFQMRGLMGFLHSYRFKSLEGTGRQVFNMDRGMIERDEQQYTLNVEAAFMLPLGDSVPVLTLNQTILIETIDTP